MVEDNSLTPTCREGELYLSIPIIWPSSNVPFDILGWWSEHEGAFPHLARVAKDILAIPIAEVGVEREFNIAKDLIGSRRHRLAARKIQQIMVLRSSLCQEESLIDADLIGGEGELPDDEVDDLFELQGQSVFPLQSESTIGISDGEEEDVDEQQEAEEAEEELHKPPPRKWRKPSRYL